MSKRSKILTKLDKVLNKLNVYHGDVYKRVIHRSGGDALLGKGGIVSKEDILIVPKPALFYPKYQGISQNNDPYIVGNVSAQIGDVILLVSYNAITLEEINNPELCFVVVDSDGFEEEFYIIASDKNIHIEGQRVVYMFLLRSRVRKP